MFLQIKNEDKKTIISFLDCDRIDVTNLKVIKEQLSPIILESNENPKVQEHILDFYNIEFIDSSGLSMIISLHKNVIKYNKNIKIINANDMVSNIFKITKLNTFVNVSTR